MGKEIHINSKKFASACIAISQWKGVNFLTSHIRFLVHRFNHNNKLENKFEKYQVPIHIIYSIDLSVLEFEF